MVDPKERKWIVLDLDSTLIFSQSDISQLARSKLLTNPDYFKYRDRLYIGSVSNPRIAGDGNSSRFWGIRREGLEDFIEWLLDNFNVIVWTAGTRPYGEQIVKIIFPKRKPYLIFSQTETDFDENMNSTKPLSKLMDDKVLGKYINFENIIIVDDNHYNFRQNTCNGILIPPFTISREEEETTNPLIYERAILRLITTKDTALADLKAWLMKVKDEPDLCILDKNSIFKNQFPISALLGVEVEV